MKFKRLPDTELKKLEKDFVQFLVSNTITADDWEKLKTSDKTKVEELIDLFSDIVYQKVMEKIEYLEFRSVSDIKSFKCGKEEIELIMIQVNESLGLDLRKPNELKKLEHHPNTIAENVKLLSASKKYNPSREEEVFNIMNNGAVKTDSTMFLLLENLYKKIKEN